MTAPDEPTERRPAPAHTVRAATRDDQAAIAQAMAEAFWDDPVQEFLLPNPKDRHRRLQRLFAVLFRGHYFPVGSVWTTPERSGAAWWAPPGRATLPPAAVLRHSVPMLRSLGRYTPRALKILGAIEKAHPKERHWYLGILGTRPADQGKGIGSALLAPILRTCDEEGIPAYLESSKYSNLAFYRRHGFEVTGEIALPGGGPPVWPMWRDPDPGRLAER